MVFFLFHGAERAEGDVFIHSEASLGDLVSATNRIRRSTRKTNISSRLFYSLS